MRVFATLCAWRLIFVRATKADLELEAQGAAHQVAVYVDLTKGEKKRDKARVQLGDLFVNLIRALTSLSVTPMLTTRAQSWRLYSATD